ncbi:hypothetical protein D3C87_1856120 [compost metagenome]
MATLLTSSKAVTRSVFLLRTCVSHRSVTVKVASLSVPFLATIVTSSIPATPSHVLLKVAVVSPAVRAVKTAVAMTTSYSS